MDKSHRFHLILFALATVAAVGCVWFFSSTFQPSSGEAATRFVHVYNNPSVRLNSIRIKVFSAVPKNHASSASPTWDPNELTRVLSKMVLFHEKQYRGLSHIVFDVYPKPVILERENGFYDTDVTDRGNPHALISVGEEIERRVFRQGGDLYLPEFSVARKGEYRVMGLIYEGVGAAGGLIYESGRPETEAEIAKRFGIQEALVHKVDIASVDGFFLVSRDFLVKPEYAPNASALTYHEFSHTLGLPDEYDAVTGAPTSNDIMGIGRFTPIESAFIDSVLLEKMGL